MSQFPVVGDVDETLRRLLWSYMEHDSSITAILAAEQQISFEPPFRLVQDGVPQQNNLSLYLYRVVENADLKNRPLQPLSATEQRYPPLVLDFYYLITPLTNSASNDHLLLGKTMQIFYDNAIVQGSALTGELAANAEELRLSLYSMSFEDQTKLWSAFLRSLRLSVAYKVGVVAVDSERVSDMERVRRKRLEFQQIGAS